MEHNKSTNSTPGDRVILHCDCNSYFASVEAVLRPELNDVPMAVCGDPEGRRGIIVAKNELAKKYGIKTTDTVWQAKKKCPNLTLVVPHHNLYSKFCGRINDIYEQYTDQVEAFSIDESWLDVTGSERMFGSGEQIANELRRRIREEIGVTISVGVSYNKVFAKMGSDYKKPDATTVITRENYREILHPLPVTDLLFIGEAAAAQLNRAGITTIGDLARRSAQQITTVLGKSGETAWAYANGLDDSPVRHRDEHDPAKSIANMITFHRDLVGMDDIKSGLQLLADNVGARLRASGLQCHTVQLQIKNPALKVINRQKTLKSPTSLTREIYHTALNIIEDSWNPSAPIRMIMMTLSSLSSEGEEPEQLTLFEAENDQRDKLKRLESAVDGIRSRFGKGAISIGRTVRNELSGDDWKERDTYESEEDGKI